MTAKGQKPGGKHPPKHVLFVCTGNVCRSPMAEYLMASGLNPESGWTVRSAGLSAMHGVGATDSAVEVMREKGV